MASKDDGDSQPGPHLRSMFVLHCTKETSCVMRCQLCLPKKVDISAYNSTSKLREHVARIHPNKLIKYTELVDSNKKRKCSSSDEPPTKSMKITDLWIPPRRLTQATVDRLVLNFVCEANQPFSVVERQSFKTMIETLHPHCTLMTRKTLCSRIQEAAKDMKSIIIKKLSAVNHVATTTDCWSARQRSYLGVTCHWIDPTTLDRHSAALACRRVKGSYTFNVLAAALEEIHSDYHIREKVTRTTTDSGSNFLKAFPLYGVEEKEDHEKEESPMDEASDDESESELEYQDVSAILDYDTGLEYQLPKHQKCACHLLNLVATVDASVAEVRDKTYRLLSRSAFGKCTALWNKTSRSSTAFEMVERECNLQFLRPNQTRWNSVFFAVERVVRIHRERGESAIRNVCQALKINMLNPAEMAFLAEYVAVMKPVAIALNILQGESSVHMGFLLPTLHQLQIKMKKVALSSKVCVPLIKALQDGIQKRFENMMKDPELIAAAILLPKFRASWTTQRDILKIGLDYIKNHLDIDPDDADNCTSSSLSDEDYFFGSMKKTQTGELERYLSCPSTGDMDLLHSFPLIKRLSLKLNTSLPASAACEKLFSHAGLLFTAKRSQLHCRNLESQLLLKLNSHFNE
ncbi:uncharacterized protein LOC112153794 [Oryzias melastigma]|uniref:Uncharacterized LOC112153794 n=1 Tax=Oryzias melastigma TaxID=30732 RepID=A0A3B3DQ39_ORYME|nr:uncharacterized protein LOC112153794 [Oryzias melastigma]